MRLARFKVEQAGGVWKKPRKVKPKPIRHEYAYLIYWYEELRRANVRNWKVEPVPYSEIQAFSGLHKLDLESFEVDALRNLDVLWLKCLPKEKDPPKARN